MNLPKHLDPVSEYPEAHFLQRAGPLPMQPTQAGWQSEERMTIAISFVTGCTAFPCAVHDVFKLNAI